MADEKKSSGKSKALTQLEKDVYETFGMLPNEDRLTLLPRYKKGEGLIAPEFMYDLAKAVQSPRTAMYSELSPEEAINMGMNVMGGSSVASAPRGALRMGIARPTLEPERRAALMEAERALPLNLPRAPAKSKQEIAAHAERVGRQMLGEHVRTGKPKDAQNLAGRSMKESQRLQKLQYELEPIKTLPPLTTVQPKIGDINVAVPGDASISDILLKSIEGEPIGSVQQGGSLYGLGKLDRDDPLFWASNEGPAQQMQDKITDLAALFDPERVLAQHLAMGRVANNFAQHFADASLRAIDYSKLSAKDMNTFDNVIAGGYTKKDKKTGEVKRITFPNWPGIADPEGALAAMKSDPEMRKWFLSRMKTRKLTKATNMPNALDIEWAITHPELRNMEVNLTGHSVGEMVPGAKLADDPDHETYLKGIRGTFLGQQENLTPFAISYPDAAQHVASTQRPQDFTGTIQKVFPHQRVDQQYLDEYYEYMRQLQKMLTGRKKGGAVKKAEGGDIDANVFAFKDPYSNVAGLNASLGGSPLEDVDVRAIASLIQNASPQDIKKLMLDIELAKRFGLTLDEKGVNQLYAKIGGDNSSASIGYSPQNRGVTVNFQKSFADGGKVNGGSKFELPDEVNPSNWREHLQNNVLADARALLGAKDGGVINLDELIEKSLEKKDGGVINLDELIAWTLAKDEHRKMKEGGAVKMADGGQAFPLQRPEEVTDLKPRPRTKRDELLEMLSKGVGSVHEFMAKPFGYENPPGEMVSSLIGLPGTAKTLERMAYGDPLTSGAGMTTNLLPETTEAAFLGLGATPTALKATKAAGKALAPTAMEMLDLELANMMKPYQMAVAPEGKAGKIKAPANPVGFYNPAEKAALNLQRKKGPGSAFISDLKKQPGVTDERIAELGLTDLASNPNVTREEVIAAVEQNRIPLRESVRRPYDEAAEYSDTISGIEDSLIYYRGGVKDVQAELERVRKMAPNSPLVKQYEDKLAVMRDKVDELEAKLDSTKPAKFGPDVDESYSLPGGEDYREIRVRLPESKAELPNMEGFTVETLREIPRTGQRDVRIRDAQGNVVTTLYTEFGDDERILKTVAAQLNKEEKGKNNFYHQSHHDNEPNVLFHLRVANHVDEEGKRGLLIDELQSDWHQTGREKGYKGETPQISWEDPEYVAARRKASDLLNEYNSNNTNPARQKEIEPLLKAAREEERRFTDLSNAYYRAVPNAPFKDNWYQLGLKRAIKEAVDTGMDRVYLTTGARQADRYDLSKQLSRVSYQDGVLHGYDKSGSLVVNKAMTPDELPNYVGKDLGKKMVENAQKDAEIRNKISVARYEGRPESEINALRSQLDGVKTDYAGVDLKVGGEGMKQYYDKNYKNYLEKYAKQHGGKLGETRLPGAAPTRNQLSTKDIENMMDNPEFKKILDEEFIRVANEPRVTGEVKPQGNGYFEIEWSDGTKMGGFSEEGARGRLAFGRNYPSGEARAWNAALKRFNAEPVYYIDLTDAMRESAKKGQSYADGGGVFNTDPDITDAGRIIPEHTI